MRWWQFGLIGGVVLSLATAGKFDSAIVTGRAGEVDWGAALPFALAIFAMGSICGLVVWMGRGLHRRIGIAGDAIVGVTVMLLFFVSCMLLFDPAMLVEKFRSGGLFMLGFAFVIGLIAGPWIAHDVRKEIEKARNESR